MYIRSFFKNNNKALNSREFKNKILHIEEFNIKKHSVNIFANVPHKIKDKKVCGFVEGKSELVDVISKKDFPIYKDKKKVKQLVKKYDFFIYNKARFKSANIEDYLKKNLHAVNDSYKVTRKFDFDKLEKVHENFMVNES